MKKLLSIICISAILFSCYTDRKATEQITKAILKKPALTADLTRKAFPCITTSSDTTIVTTDTIINVDCPDTTKATEATEYFTIHDTTIKRITKTIKVPITIQLPSKIIVQKVKDSADILVLNDKLTIANNKISVLENKISIKNKWMLWEFVVILLLALGNIVQFKKWM